MFIIGHRSSKSKLAFQTKSSDGRPMWRSGGWCSPWSRLPWDEVQCQRNIFCQQITFVKRRFYGIRLKWAHKESSINKVCGDYGLPKFWGEYIRKRGRFDKKIKLDPVGSAVHYEVMKLYNGW